MKRFKLICLNILYIVIILGYLVAKVIKLPMSILLHFQLWYIYLIVFAKRHVGIKLDEARAQKA